MSEQNTYTNEELASFEDEIAEIYENGVIHAPIHLRSGNESQLIEIFKDVNEQDYVYSTWASHLHCLLKGVPREQAKQAILEGRSITLNFPEYNFYSSAIVGGTPSIAVGTAYAIKQKGKNSRVFCFLGDMGFHAGIAYESIKYAIGHDLPITFVVEDNGKSVGTPTSDTWRVDTRSIYELMNGMASKSENVKMKYYQYGSKYPHAGTGTFVEF